MRETLRSTNWTRWAWIWAFRASTFALIVANAFWSWGDWMPPSTRSIDASIARGDLVEAERSLLGRLRWCSQDGDARMKLARLLVKRGDNLEGARALHLVPFWWPSKGEAEFLEGQAFKRARRAVEAEAAWKSCTEVDPLHPVASPLYHGAAKELVTLYVLEGRLDEARDVLWRAFEEGTPEEKPGILATRVRAELERIDHQEAVATLRGYVEADPANRPARLALAVEEHSVGDEAASDRDLEACFRADADDPLAWRARLDILNDRGDVEAYKEAVDRLPPSTSKDSRAWMHRGLARQRSEDREGAVEAFRKAVELGPYDPEVIYKLGMAEVASGQPVPGREHLARTRQLRQAYEALREAYHDFLDLARKSSPDEAGYRSTLQRLATHCRTLGWAREADGWLALLPPA